MKNIKMLRSVHGEINIEEGATYKLGYCVVCNNVDTFTVYKIKLAGLVFRICKKCFAILKGKEMEA